MNGAIILMLIAFSYFLPAFVAIGRGHKEFLGISIINIFLGWTLLGWVIALAWAFTSNTRPNDAHVKKTIKSTIESDVYCTQCAYLMEDCICKVSIK